MATIEAYKGDRIPYVMLGTSGTSGDLCYISTGSIKTLKSNANSGTENTSAFAGLLIESTVKGSYGAVLCEGVANLTKLASTNKIEVGDIIYADGAASDNKVGTVVGGTAIGICAKQSSTTDTTVAAKLLPFYITGAGGYHA